MEYLFVDRLLDTRGYTMNLLEAQMGRSRQYEAYNNPVDQNINLEIDRLGSSCIKTSTLVL